MWDQRFPITHYELNYLVQEEVALRIRYFIQGYLQLDELGIGRPDYAYPVHTLYLDSDNLDLYWKAINDSEHRWQLRIQTHADSLNTIEIKRRVSGLVLRERCEVEETTIRQIVAGQFPKTSQLVNCCAKDIFVLQKFIKLKESLDASPKLHVAYMREGYVSDEQTARVTFDREIVCQAINSQEWSVELDSPCSIFQGRVLLELNFRERYPDWLRELVRAFDLTECEADKFVTGMSAVGQALRGPWANRPFTNLPFE